jgi:hypothetical protein
MDDTIETPVKKGRKPRSVGDGTPKTRTRKVAPAVVYTSYDPSIESSALEGGSDDENVILKLNVSMNNLDNGSVNDLPDAYNEDNMDAFDSKPEEIRHHCNGADIDDHQHQQPSTTTFSDISQAPMEAKVVHLLRDFEEKNKNNEWPSNTSISCYWCCHRFDNPPFGIPVKYVDGKFQVYGCFCSLECAAAHNLSCRDSIDEMWERYNLINLLARKVGYEKSFVKPAPNRLTLRMFGGHIAIEDFRKYTETNKIININFPPMMTMTQQIEEINESDINNDYKYIPLDTDRINKYKEKTKLKRIKPLHDFKNTLDHAMNLKIGGGSS